MSDIQPVSIAVPAEYPRHAHQEVADLLAAAILRLRRRHSLNSTPDSESVGLGFSDHQRVNANPAHARGVRP